MTESSQFAQNFLYLGTESSASWETTQSQATGDGGSP